MLTEKIANFVSGIRTEDIPQDALDKARMGMTDFIGVALAGSQEEVGRLIREYGNRMGGVAEASIIADDKKTSPEMAALINGTMGHALDYDDMSVSPIAHPSVFLAPAILALGESIGASGLDALVAYVVGYEVAGCVAEPMFQSHYVQGWHGTSTFGSLGAAAAAARLLRLNPRQVTDGDRDRGVAGLRLTAELRHHDQTAARGQSGCERDSGSLSGPGGVYRRRGHYRGAAGVCQGHGTQRRG